MQSDSITRVHITVDTEFSIAGAFQDPSSHKPVGQQAVYCNYGGRSHGLGYLLETLGKYGLRGTFFVEALNTCYFGDDPMGEIAGVIRDSGHDVQLHLHPCWTYFLHEDWVKMLIRKTPDDDITTRSIEEMQRLIKMGQETFVRWGMHSPVVLRTGGLKVSRSVYTAMNRCGIHMASNVGLSIYRPAEKNLHLYSGRHDIEGVVEYPVTTYSDIQLFGKNHLKTLTITGTSWGEMRSLLMRASNQGVTDIVVLTHPFEYIKHKDLTYETVFPDRVNRWRLDKLCEFVSKTPGFEAVCISECSVQTLPAGDTLLQAPPLYAAGRIVVNRINHSLMRL